ncbi:hypothetical protein H4S01_003833 [Coemansia sp. RSA 2610]|nr:hypothetical protein H4S01_003833 [Coemansia sp. RSA 2610]
MAHRMTILFHRLSEPQSGTYVPDWILIAQHLWIHSSRVDQRHRKAMPAFMLALDDEQLTKVMINPFLQHDPKMFFRLRQEAWPPVLHSAYQNALNPALNIRATIDMDSRDAPKTSLPLLGMPGYGIVNFDAKVIKNALLKSNLMIENAETGKTEIAKPLTIALALRLRNALVYDTQRRGSTMTKAMRDMEARWARQAQDAYMCDRRLPLTLRKPLDRKASFQINRQM